MLSACQWCHFPLVAAHNLQLSSSLSFQPVPTLAQEKAESAVSFTTSRPAHMQATTGRLGYLDWIWSSSNCKRVLMHRRTRVAAIVVHPCAFLRTWLRASMHVKSEKGMTGLNNPASRSRPSRGSLTAPIFSATSRSPARSLS
ncbi:hypothetical protein K402DRAFT_178839 [Aulographum hederae CBS 113979]|uniref:Uncharacterized protein n=1 Tax=Aulographum hederae CBS 113979 TaxID=1176131 RepID=A0A6G1GQE2_9PEZI|nr:hypothetical protein K402DRAFT_178839 [Aulographum hederae CBS 113979]